MDCGIYEILNTRNGKRYIGQSIDTNKRIYQHRFELDSNRHCNHHLQFAYNKFKDLFEFKTILICSKEDLNFYENLIICGYKTLDREFGYNIRSVDDQSPGYSSGTKHGAKISTFKTAKRSKFKGQKFTKLTLIEEVGKDKHGRTKWSYLCDCGNVGVADLSCIKRGHTTSCGCSRIKPDRPYSRHKKKDHI